MDFQILTAKPWWLIIFCIALGAVSALLLYRNDSQFSEVHPWLRKLMFAFRFVCITLLAALLLEPLIRTITRQVENPLIIIAQDNSQSLGITADSSFYRNEYANALGNLAKNLEGDYEIRTYSFGDKVSPQLDFSFNQKQTNFSALFDDLSVQYANRNLGAVIIASDGLYNAGSSPVYLAEKLKVPFYTIAMGDTAVHKDLLISRVNHNKVAYLGNSFPLEIIIDAWLYSGNKTTLIIEKDSSVIYQREIAFANDKFHIAVPVYLDAKSKGIQQYKVKLMPLAGELSTANNTANVFVEVLESRQKVLLLANSPHPDIAAVKNAVESSQNYELTIAYARNFENNFKGYNLVILHGLPSQNFNAQPFFEKLKSEEVSVWYILSSQTSISAFNNLKAGLTISNANGTSNDVLCSWNKNFSMFTLSSGASDLFEKMPPLVAPFGTYKTNVESGVLINQRIGNVSTDQPLLVFNEAGGNRTAILCGEGIWKWGLKEMSEKNTRNQTDEFIQKIVQYLSVKESKAPFRIKYKNNFLENEPVQLDAELYNDAGELVNEPDARIIITSAEKKTYPYTFSKTEKAYTLNAGYFDVGNYSFSAEVKLGDKIYIQKGQFAVTPLHAELTSTTADHQVLSLLASRTGGRMVYPAQLKQLEQLIKERKDITSVSYTQKQLKDVINLKWVFALLMLLLTAEWFLRKRSGAY